jgi:hypothetical protein
MAVMEFNLMTGELVERDYTADELAAMGTQPPATPLQQITAIEAANPVTHRMLRELTLSVAQIASAVTGKAPEENPAVRDIQALEVQIAALRAQAKEQGLIP